MPGTVATIAVKMAITIGLAILTWWLATDPDDDLDSDLDDLDDTRNLNRNLSHKGETVSTAEILKAHAGDEETVRGHVEAAIAESRPLPVWEESTEMPPPAGPKRNIDLQIGRHVKLHAWSHGGGPWWTVYVGVNLSGSKGEVTAANRIQWLREAAERMEEALPVLRAMIASAEAVGVAQ